MKYLDSRDLENELNELLEQKESGEEIDEERLKDIQELKNECEHYGWEHGITFIPEDAFREYAEEIFDDLYSRNVPDNIKAYIDYDKFAEDLSNDYSSSEFDGYTYLWMGA